MQHETSIVSSQVFFANPITAPFNAAIKADARGLFDAQLRIAGLQPGGFSDGIAVTLWAKNLTNKAYIELEELAVLANKTYPKKMLGEYLLGEYYQSKDDFKMASKSYLKAFQMDSIGDLKKQMMMDKSDEMRSKISKPGKK